MLTSLENPRLKSVSRFFRDASFRKKWPFFVLENPKHIQDVVEAYPSLLVYGLFSSEQPFSFPKAAEKFEVEPRLWKQLSPLPSPTGVMAVFHRPDFLPVSKLKDARRVLYLDGVSDPSNVGAIARSASAFGWDGMVIGRGTADPFHPESLRASAGHIVDLPLFPDISDFSGFQIVTLDPSSKTLVESVVLSDQPLMLVLGSEGRGLSDKWSEMTSVKCVSLPMSARVESLNVAVTAGIVTYFLR